MSSRKKRLRQHCRARVKTGRQNFPQPLRKPGALPPDGEQQQPDSSGLPPSREGISGMNEGIQVLGAEMAEKVKKLNLQRDYKTYLYYLDGQGNVCQKPKSGEGDSEVLVPHA